MSSDEKSEDFVKCYHNRKFNRKVPVVFGGLYLVEPMNPMKRKYRGEKVILVEVDGIPKVLRVESESDVKNKKYTDIDICDLRLLRRKPSKDLTGLLE